MRLAVERGNDEDIARIDAIRVEYEHVLASSPFSETIGDKLENLTPDSMAPSEKHHTTCS